MHIRFLADLIENYVLTRLPGICYFLDKREARKSLKAFLLQPRLKPNILSICGQNMSKAGV